jgi:hypothetical protein
MEVIASLHIFRPALLASLTTYLSAASRTTQAIDTFFSFAITSRVSQRAAGKLMDARTPDVLCIFTPFPPLFEFFMNEPLLIHHLTPYR